MMATDKEIISQYRDKLEKKDNFIWALGEEAEFEMRKTVRDNDPNKMNINQQHSLSASILYQKEKSFKVWLTFSG